MLHTTAIAPTNTVNETIVHYPATVTVFKEVGIDSCCGGSLSIAEAAKRHGVELSWLIAALRRIADQMPRETSGAR